VQPATSAAQRSVSPALRRSLILAEYLMNRRCVHATIAGPAATEGPSPPAIAGYDDLGLMMYDGQTKVVSVLSER
jgi:hypothetical protein